MEKSKDTIGNRTRDLPACSAVPQPTAPPRAPTRNMYRKEINIHEKELCVKLVIYKDYTAMHGQQNIKYMLDE